MEDECSLEEFKKSYSEIQKKYGLPEFDELNKDFTIEKLADIETDFLVREIRKFIADRFSNYLRFIETLLNPSNSPMFVYSVIKTFGNEERIKLTEIYKKLARAEVDLIEIDVDFSEEKEAKFVKDSYKMWQEIKKDILEIVDVIKKNWDNKTEKNGKGYFG